MTTKSDQQLSLMSTSPSLPLAFFTSPAMVNVTANGSTPCDVEDPTLRLPLAACYFVIFLLGLAGNLFALWVFLFLQSSRNSVRVLLIHCAVADLVLLACLPFRLAYHLNGNRWTLGGTACRLVGNLFYMNMYVSIALLGLIGLHRYLRLGGRGRSRSFAGGGGCVCGGRRWPWSLAVCSGLWALSLAGVAPMIAASEDRDTADKCFHYRPRSGPAKAKAYVNAVLVGFFWLVFALLAVCYGRIARQLQHASRDKPGLPNAQRYGRTARKSFIVLLLFAICFVPYHTFRPFYVHAQLHKTQSCEHARLLERVNEVMLLLSALNSCLDPVMYFLLSGSVRRAALQTLGGHFRSEGGITTNSSTTEGRRSSLLPPPLTATLLNAPRTSICIAKQTELSVLPPVAFVDPHGKQDSN